LGYAQHKSKEFKLGYIEGYKAFQGDDDSGHKANMEATAPRRTTHGKDNVRTPSPRARVDIARVASQGRYGVSWSLKDRSRRRVGPASEAGGGLSEKGDGGEGWEEFLERHDDAAGPAPPPRPRTASAVLREDTHRRRRRAWDDMDGEAATGLVPEGWGGLFGEEERRAPGGKVSLFIAHMSIYGNNH